MPEQKKTSDRGVVDSIAALRLLRYNTKGPGAKRSIPRSHPPAKLPTVTAIVEQLREKVAKIPVKSRKKKTKQKGRRR